MDAMSRLTSADAVARLANRDPALFSDDVDMRSRIQNRLGWTDLAERAALRLPLIASLAAEMADEGIADVVVLGMGGSSLAPLVIDRILEQAEGAPRLHVLDSTAPSATARLLDTLTPLSTAFVLASKSGTTIEPLALYALFREWMDEALGRVTAGKRFIVITDPGSPLVRTRQKEVMRVAIAAPATVGGRFSALSVFGLIPPGLAGHDIERLVDYARVMERACHGSVESNPGALLGAWIADRHAAGRDKLTFVASECYRPFGLWVEQLVAESTGKLGTGIVPVLEDGGVPVTAYGDDRALVIMRDDTDAREAEYARLAREAGVPVIELVPPEPAAIGAEFVRWTHAVALLGHLMGVNPFDEPDVAEAKAATAGVLSGDVTVPPATTDADGVWLTPAGALSGGAPPTDVASALSALFDTLRDGSYLAVLAYLPDVPELLGPVHEAAANIAVARRVPVCVELGPRYLHSTGQLHKGGPESGSFLLITTRGHTDRPVPGEPFSLARLFRAQAEGDLVTLARRGRPVLRLDLPAEDLASVTRLVAEISHALSHR